MAELQSNVLVDDVWYGPDYPDNKVTAKVKDQITNPAAFEPLPAGVDNRVRADDFEVDSTLDESRSGTGRHAPKG